MTKAASMQAQKVICDYLNAKPELARVTSEVANDIARMIDDARSAALEEAAQAATRFDLSDADLGYHETYADGRRAAAAKIRALKDKP